VLKLDRRCVRLQALKRLIDDKVVDYDFEYYQLPQPADAAVTLLSTGRSMFRDSVDVAVPLVPAGPFGEQGRQSKS
jgi:Mini-chromosome maintenance replisome factor